MRYRYVLLQLGSLNAMTAALNEYGDAGWEAISVVHVPALPPLIDAPAAGNQRPFRLSYWWASLKLRIDE